MTIPMPEPFAGLQYNSGWDSWEQVVPSAVGQPGVVSVFTQEQMEAYAAAKVRESLVQAESILRGNAKACKSLAVKVLLSANADAIGELIPPLPGPVEPTD